MTLPETVLNFLYQSAKQNRASEPKEDVDLFKTGVLDSFALIDLVSVLEEQCMIKVPDADVNAANFQSINAIERYVEARRG